MVHVFFVGLFAHPIPKTGETIPMLLGATLFLVRQRQTAVKHLGSAAETAR